MKMASSSGLSRCAGPICVVNEYRRPAFNVLTQERVGGAETLVTPIENFGWHNCATVIDPMIGDPPSDQIQRHRLATFGHRAIGSGPMPDAVLTDPFPDIELED